MIKPKEISIMDIDGDEKTYIITRFPATVGMEILYKLPSSGIPKIGDFGELKEVRNEIFRYIYVKTDNGDIALSTKALIDNHITDGETAYKIMGAILSYNYQSLGKLMSGGLISSMSEKILNIARRLLTELSPQSSAKNKRH